MARVNGGILPGDVGYMENKDWMADIEPRDIENQRLIERNIELERKANTVPAAPRVIERNNYVLPNFDPLRSAFARSYFDFSSYTDKLRAQDRVREKDEEIEKLKKEKNRLANIALNRSRSKSRSKSRSRSKSKPRSKSKSKSKK